MFPDSFFESKEEHSYQLTIDEILKYAKFVAPDRKLVHAPPELPPREFTYSEFDKRVKAVGNFLNHLGVKRAKEPREMGTKVAVMDWNSIRYQELLYAIPMYGATLFTVNIRLALDDMIYTLNDAKPEVLFVDTSFVEHIERITQEVKSIKKVVLMDDKITCTGEGELPDLEVRDNIEIFGYENQLEKNMGDYNWPEKNENIIANIFYTGGTTGRPKGVYFTHRQLVLGALLNMIGDQLYPHPRSSSRDTLITVVPYFHVLGWGVPYFHMMMGKKFVFTGKYDWEHVAKLIQEEIPEAKEIDGVVMAQGVPTMLKMILDETEKMGKNLDGFVFGYGGMACPLNTYEKAKELGADIFAKYGPSETGMTALTWGWMSPRIWQKMGTDEEKFIDYCVENNTLGTLTPLADVKLVDKEDKELPHDGETSGRALFRSPTILEEYYKAPEKTEEAYRGEWFDFKDACTIDEYGLVNFFDREKFTIKSGGEWIPTPRFEGMISTHEAVSEVVVVGLPHPEWGERPVAFIKPEEGKEVTGDDIRKYLEEEYVASEKIPKWWIPDKIQFLDKIPKTSASKKDRSVLKRKAVEIFKE